MSFLFTCPYCGEECEADDDMIDQEIECPECANIFVLEGDDEEFEMETDDEPVVTLNAHPDPNNPPVASNTRKSKNKKENPNRSIGNNNSNTNFSDLIVAAIAIGVVVVVVILLYKGITMLPNLFSQPKRVAKLYNQAILDGNLSEANKYSVSSLHNANKDAIRLIAENSDDESKIFRLIQIKATKLIDDAECIVDGDYAILYYENTDTTLAKLQKIGGNWKCVELNK